MAEARLDRAGTSEPPRALEGARLNLLLFALTVITVFQAGAIYARSGTAGGEESFSDFLRSTLDPRVLISGWTFAVPLLAILLAHEFGHYFAARYHRVPASLPYFIPLPILSPFGTMGAVIAMPGVIRSRKALLDIGAAGPLAGLVVALPVLLWGIALSPVAPPPEGAYTQEGQSILYSFIKWLVHGSIPAGSDVLLHPTALAGWAGLLVTMINLLPFGQLDGGHIAYALFGKKQDRFAPWMRRALLLLFAYNVALFVVPVLVGKSELPLVAAFSNSLFWLVWYAFLGLLGRFAGDEHPPFEAGELSPKRRAVAWLCLAVLGLLFMPTPWAVMP